LIVEKLQEKREEICTLLIHIVDMILMLVFGMNSAFLFPSGSSNEEKIGISHLFEHIIIKKIHAKYGLTTEDYFIIFTSNLSHLEMVENLKKMVFDNAELGIEKEFLIKEIEKKKNNPGEIFFRNIWRDFKYSKSPLGKKQDIQRVSILDILNLKNKIIKTGFISTNEKSQIISFKEFKCGYNYKCAEITFIKKKAYKNYSIIFFKNAIEYMYLLERILRQKNPNKHIQLSEKKDISAFIMEKGIIFPNIKELIKLKEYSQKQIWNELNLIALNFYNRAINELESYYYYNLSWQQRINCFLNITNFNLIEIQEKIKSFYLS